MAYSYDINNIFAKILRGEILNDTVLETDHVLAFRDLYPKAPDHVLVIPKGPYVCFDDFAKNATDVEVIEFTRTVGQICDLLGVSPDQGDGYRMIANAGPHGVQEVPHYHVHILGGHRLGRMINAD